MTGDEPAGLRAAVLAYEAALMANDVAGLDDWFEAGDDTIRSDAEGMRRGHDAISAFRQSRKPVPPRRITRLELRSLAPAVAAAVIEVEPLRGGRGVLTQVWRYREDRWRIAVAQVAAPGAAVDGRIWRVAGAPLVPGASAGPLAGMTVAVKDLFAVAGFAVGAGNPAWLAEAPTETTHAPAVRHLLDAGASITGIARTDEFAYAISGEAGRYGVPPNAAVAGAVPGGSSSGSASAVALGQADIGLGTDTGGSIRVPASYQGLWGLRSTHGAVDGGGMLPLAPSFDAAGWLARDAATLRAAAAASLPPGGASEASRFVTASPLLEGVQPEARAAFDASLGRLDVERDLDLGDAAALAEAFRVVQAAEAWEVRGAWLEAHPGVLAGAVADRFAIASRITPAERDAATAAIERARERLEGLLGDAILVIPSASSVAPRLGASAEQVRAATLRLTCVAGVLGRPALGIPALQVDGAPVGLCFVGPRGSDLGLIDRAVELFG